MGTAYRHDFVSLDSDAANAATNVSADILPVVLESLAFGFYTMLVILTSLVILRSHDKLVSRKTILLVVCAAMYAAAATHIGITLALLFATNGQLDMALCAADMACTSCASDASACPASQILDPGVLARPGVLATMPTALLSLNMILGDLVVLWRALVLWPRRRAVQVVSTTLVAGTLGMLGWVVVGDYGLQNYYSGSIALLTSWITNVWSTALITVRAWQHRRRVGVHLRVGSRTRAEAALLIFVESGALYCLLWIPLIITSVIHVIGACSATYRVPDNLVRLVDGTSDVQLGLLIDIVGIYPTAVILLLKLSDYYAQRTLSLNNMPTLLPQHKLVVQPRTDHRARTSFGEP